MTKKFIMVYKNDNNYLELENLFFELIDIIEKIERKNAIIYIYNYANNDIKEIFLSYIADLLSNIKMYESKFFINETYLNNHIEFIYKAFEKYYNSFEIYENHKSIIRKLNNYSNKELRKQFLGKYHDDFLMINTLKTFFNENQNFSKAAKKLYIHRNTLLQRIDKFIEETNFDPKIFLEGILIYDLIN
jgi:cysteinyl-tRNA synthetase